MAGYASNGVRNFAGTVSLSYATLVNSGRTVPVVGTDFTPMTSGRYRMHAIELAPTQAAATMRGLAVVRPFAPRLIDTEGAAQGGWQGSLDLFGNVLLDSVLHLDGASLAARAENNVLISTWTHGMSDDFRGAPAPPAFAASTYTGNARTAADALAGVLSTQLPTRLASGQRVALPRRRHSSGRLGGKPSHLRGVCGLERCLPPPPRLARRRRYSW